MLTIVLLFWLVIGIILWIPLLSRTIFTYTFVLSASMFTTAPVARSAHALEFASSFYVEGFRKIISSLYEKAPEKEKPAYASTLDFNSVIAIITNSIWTMIFWGFLIIGIVIFQDFAVVDTILSCDDIFSLMSNINFMRYIEIFFYMLVSCLAVFFSFYLVEKFTR